MTDRKQFLAESNKENETLDQVLGDPEKSSLVLSDSLPLESSTEPDTNGGGTTVSHPCCSEAIAYDRFLDRDQLLDVLSAAVVITDMDQRILWSNQSFRSLTETLPPEGMPFYDTLPDSVLEGPDFCPFRTVRKEEKRTTTNILAKGHYFEMQISPIRSHETGKVVHCVVEMRDTTEITRIDQTLRKLQTVGRQLVDLSPEELGRMSPSGRIELLKSRIEKNMRTILNYDIVEFRLLDKATNRLEPLLAFGLPPEAIQRELYASSDGNGITGYVAHNKVCYACEDTLEHDMYLQGAPNARSSLTVPLVYHDEVIGTCNVESCRPGAFTQRDMYFLQLFTRDVAVALHTFDLLSYESEKAVSDSVQAILSEVSLPIDQIVQDAAVLMNEYLGNEPEAKKRLESILRTSRNIKGRINVYGSQKGIDAAEVNSSEQRPLLNNRTILVIDQEESVLRSAHDILEEFHCVVETAPDAITALNMIKTSHYDVIVTEIKPLGGMSAYQLMLRMFELTPEKTVLPLIFTAGYGYDGGHTIVNAKMRGLLGVIFKPLIRAQLLNMIEKVINTCGKRDAAGNLIPPAGDNLESSTGTGMGKQGNASQCGSTQKITGFYKKGGAQRFDEWAQKFTQFVSENNLEEGNIHGGPSIDAT